MSALFICWSRHRRSQPDSTFVGEIAGHCRHRDCQFGVQYCTQVDTKPSGQGESEGRESVNRRQFPIGGKAHERIAISDRHDPVKLRSRPYSRDERRLASGTVLWLATELFLLCLLCPEQASLFGAIVLNAACGCLPLRSDWLCPEGMRFTRSFLWGFVMVEHHQHLAFMQRALELARRAEGRTSPNPMVGAVIVNDGRIVGEGYHRRAGAPHAEIEALHAAGEAARGGIMYVTLEPCAHYGRTPPCTDALIAAGIAEVYYAISDPNPKVSGKGHAQLVAAGLRVHQGLCAAEAHQLNRPYLKHITTGYPFVTAKFAMSLDGKIATNTGHSRWISNAASRQRVHQLRNLSDAILVGSGTVIADDPLLTTRLVSTATDADSDIRHPLRIIVDSRGRVPLTARVFDPSLPGTTVLATTAQCPEDYRHELTARGVEIWILPTDATGRVSLPDLLAAVGQRGLLTVLVEGGSELLGALFSQRLVDRVLACIAPIIIGGRNAPGPVGGTGWSHLNEVARLCQYTCTRVVDETAETADNEPDVWIQADVTYPEGASCLPVL